MSWKRECIDFDRMFWEDPQEKVTFYLSTDLSEVRKPATWTSGEERSRQMARECKGPGAELSLVCLGGIVVSGAAGAE